MIYAYDLEQRTPYQSQRQAPCLSLFHRNASVCIRGDSPATEYETAHVMRHTVCTRMAECRMDVKVLQYIMGHAHIDVTMEVYNHIGELTRIENEIARLDSMVLNA